MPFKDLGQSVEGRGPWFTVLGCGEPQSGEPISPFLLLLLGAIHFEHPLVAPHLQAQRKQ